jgi:hypothetical protein
MLKSGQGEKCKIYFNNNQYKQPLIYNISNNHAPQYFKKL